MTATLNSTGVVFGDGSQQNSAARGGGANPTSAVDITLTSASSQVQWVNMTAANKYVILPNATTLPKGVVTFTIINAGANTFGIKDTNGVILIDGIKFNDGYQMSLVDNTTTGGKWQEISVTGVNPPISFGTLNTSTITPYNPGSYQNVPFASVILSSTQALIFYQTSSSTTMSVVLATISGTTVTYGTPVSVFAATYNSSVIRAVGLNSTTAVVFFAHNTTLTTYACAVTVSGSTITVGTIVSTGITSVSQIASQAQPIADSTSTGVTAMAWAPSGSSINSAVVAFSVTGSTVSFGAVSSSFITYSPSPFSASVAYCNICKLTTGTYVVAVTDDTASSARHRAFTVSGTTITPGTTTTTATGYSFPNGQGAINTGTGYAMFVEYNTTYTLQYSGTTYVGITSATSPSTFISPGGNSISAFGSSGTQWLVYRAGGLNISIQNGTTSLYGYTNFGTGIVPATLNGYTGSLAISTTQNLITGIYTPASGSSVIASFVTTVRN